MVFIMTSLKSPGGRRRAYLPGRAEPSPSSPGRLAATPRGPCGTGTRGEGGPHDAAREQRVRSASFSPGTTVPRGPSAPSPGIIPSPARGPNIKNRSSNIPPTILSAASTWVQPGKCRGQYKQRHPRFCPQPRRSLEPSLHPATVGSAQC